MASGAREERWLRAAAAAAAAKHSDRNDDTRKPQKRPRDGRVRLGRVAEFSSDERRAEETIHQTDNQGRRRLSHQRNHTITPRHFTRNKAPKCTYLT